MIAPLFGTKQDKSLHHSLRLYTIRNRLGLVLWNAQWSRNLLRRVRLSGPVATSPDP